MKQSDLRPIQLYPLGDSAITVQFGDAVSEHTLSLVRNYTAHLEQQPFAGLIEFVPAYTTVTLYYDPWVVSEKGKYNPYERVVAIIEQALPRTGTSKEKQPPKILEVPVCYGGEFGPDLAFVASHTRLSEKKVIALHSSVEYLVYMIGFVPGFPYLGGMKEEIAVPRKETPGPCIPGGSVGIAGVQTGIYPMETPGGWQLIGRTPLSLFNPYRTPPGLLKAGDLVRFRPITKAEFHKQKELAYES
ncbi:5-oxoprolinase subunit PxpB [Pontibacter liquoris]|uniref:5-oxoprolinase subunit PxpB n=1 Tax=Pontibacter liquoris TaxID=2905677 RepID=UPI001FA7429A|nr:5-oxoprolinase subunit PxpB [Pontibacter liquoris]